MKSKILLVLVIYAVLAISSIILFLYNVPVFDTSKPIDAERFNSFGGFFSGLCGTILTLIGLYFVDRTLAEQIKQSKTSTEAVEFSSITNAYATIIQEISNLEYQGSKGIHALYSFDEHHRENPNSIMNHLCLILVMFESAFESLQSNVSLPKIKIESELVKLHLLFYSKIIWPVQASIYTKLYDDYEILVGEEMVPVKGLKHHTDSVIIFEKYENLITKTYAFLLPRKLASPPLHDKKIMDIIRPLLP